MPFRIKSIFLFFLFSHFIETQAQTWRYEETNDPFNGSSKSAFITGKTTSKNYRHPILILSKPSGSDPVLIIGNAGFFQEGTRVNIKWIFDNNDKIFSTYEWSYSNNGKTLFLEKFNHSDYLVEKMELEEFLYYFTHSSNVLIRISDRFSVTDLDFSLSGFNKSTVKIIDESVIEEAYTTYLAKASYSDSLMASKMILASKLIAKAEVVFGITSYDLEKFKSQIDLDFSLPPHGSKYPVPAPYDSVFVKYTLFDRPPKKEWNKREIWIGTYSSTDQSERTMSSPFSINSDSPLLEKYETEKRTRENKNKLYASHLYTALNSLNLVAAVDELQFLPFKRTLFEASSFKEEIVSKIYYERYSYGHDPFELWDIAHITIELADEKKWRVEEGEIILSLFNGETIKCDEFSLYESNDEVLTKSRLKTLGIEGGQTIMFTIPKATIEELQERYPEFSK